MRTIVWVKLEIEGRASVDVLDAVDRALDGGELQDTINVNETLCTVVSATVESLGLTRGDGAVILTARQARAASYAMRAMLAGEYEELIGDDVTERDVRGAADKLGAR